MMKSRKWRARRRQMPFCRTLFVEGGGEIIPQSSATLELATKEGNMNRHETFAVVHVCRLMVDMFPHIFVCFLAFCSGMGLARSV
jgi:hypothetical protein